MFGILKAVLGAVKLPVDVVADVVEGFASIGETPNDKPLHTTRKAKQIMRNLHDATE
jgi:hypothetical protein